MTHIRPYLLFAIVALFPLTLLNSCQSGAIAPPAADQMAPPARVTLAAGDVVRISFTGAPELNQVQKIRADGRISLPTVGEVEVAGRTLARFQDELSARYKSELKYTDVTVTLDSGATFIYMSGAVGRPGKIALDRPTTILQAIMEAGGTNQFGNLRRVSVIRIVNGVQRTQVLDLKSSLGGETSKAFYVRDGDIISVPESPF